MIKEIGSEFWQQYSPFCGKSADNEAYLLSGRTALRFILEDICGDRKVRKALLPSYCCDSMILPFVQSGIDVEFYQVHHGHWDYPYENDADIIFLIDFFGYVNGDNQEIARRENQAGKIIIYDATHKLNGNKAVEAYADYTFCSYRKWFYCNYAKAVKHNGTFSREIVSAWNTRYMQLRENAAREKARYIAGLQPDKQRFLSDFGTAEEMLDEDYAGYVGIPVVADVEDIISRRRANAAYLIRELKTISLVSLWREELSTDDAPLFVPILVDPDIRDEFRRYLISRQIYCPIHWPRSPYHGICNELYDTELSLICDQRYDLTDMERMVRAIKDYFG